MEFESQFCHLLAFLIWPVYLTSLFPSSIKWGQQHPIHQFVLTIKLYMEITWCIANPQWTMVPFPWASAFSKMSEPIGSTSPERNNQCSLWPWHGPSAHGVWVWVIKEEAIRKILKTQLRRASWVLGISPWFPCLKNLLHDDYFLLPSVLPHHTHSHKVVGTIMTPQRCLCPNPKNLWIC